MDERETFRMNSSLLSIASWKELIKGVPSTAAGAIWLFPEGDTDKNLPVRWDPVHDITQGLLILDGLCRADNLAVTISRKGPEAQWRVEIEGEGVGVHMFDDDLAAAVAKTAYYYANRFPSISSPIDKEVDELWTRKG